MALKAGNGGKGEKGALAPATGRRSFAGCQFAARKPGLDASHLSNQQREALDPYSLRRTCHARGGPGALYGAHPRPRMPGSPRRLARPDRNDLVAHESPASSGVFRDRPNPPSSPVRSMRHSHFERRLVRNRTDVRGIRSQLLPRDRCLSYGGRRCILARIPECRMS